ncbi:MAG TPA: bifunctional histidinol-phosphatase/imidazoleglycerol-phosphate dehydratase HisB [Woeseiaceae bacterium]|nr:bifunctional histidinol-phosphatase/imidazoleglycerol-phosphate dehydratase HisB [Woeseiaceae bacterium]
MRSKVLFIDRDGTLVSEPYDFQVDSLAKVQLVDDVISSLLQLKQHGYRFVMVTNQDGLGTVAFPAAKFQQCQDFILQVFASQGIRFDEIFVCPHLPSENCDCRKPRTGLLTRYLASSNLDLKHCAVIGDRDTDLELARRIGIKGLQLIAGGAFENTWPGIVDALCYADRTATVARETKETNIRVTVSLDAMGRSEIATGIGFFDHMLEQIARHGNFRLQLTCTGDLHIDEHHSVEDIAICIGTAMRDALGDKRGIGRYGFVIPMDESEAHVAIDLSGRGNLEFVGDFPRDHVGEMSIEMVRHFFLSLADSLGAAIHIRVQGENTHHMVEACFKAVGRALRPALRLEGGDLPSTKGMLA